LEPDPQRKMGWRAYRHFYAGELEKVRAIIRNEEVVRKDYWPAHAFASSYGLLGDLDDCFRWLEKAVEAHALPLQQFQLDPGLERVRKDPRFQAVLKKMNLA
jgi:hypothetical protein